MYSVIKVSTIFSKGRYGEPRHSDKNDVQFLIAIESLYEPNGHQRISLEVVSLYILLTTT